MNRGVVITHDYTKSRLRDTDYGGSSFPRGRDDVVTVGHVATCRATLEGLEKYVGLGPLGKSVSGAGNRGT